MQSWATSKQQPGQFTGSTGAQILTAAELSGGYQAWARKVITHNIHLYFHPKLVRFHHSFLILIFYCSNNRIFV